MTIKFEFPADREDIALAISKALAEIGSGAITTISGASATVESVCTEALLAEGDTAPLTTATAGGHTDALAAESMPWHEGTEALDQAAVNDEQAAGNYGTQAGSDSGRLDEKGVAFNPQMCANAEKPFYASGKTKGQWKKKGGANGPTEEAYATWYTAELLKVTAAPAQQQAEQTIDTAAVWQAPAAAETKVPANGGEFFGWVAEMQTAGHIVQADIDAAYTANNLDVGQFWAASAQPEVQAQMVAALHRTLSAKVPA